MWRYALRRRVQKTIQVAHGREHESYVEHRRLPKGAMCPRDFALRAKTGYFNAVFERDSRPSAKEARN
jgi:hypothetical protein